MNEMWNSLATGAKIGLGIGAGLIVALAIAVGFWAYRPDYQVLFADIATADAASMTAELDRMKVPYTLADGGNTILVPREAVYKTRLKLMGKDLPLHGAVGFEVFNNADFGMTEFVQKVNYQRAVQGELTRTILSIDDIQSARVHLAIPDQGLFKKTTSTAKASVTLVMKPGKALAPDQVAGIQRLVAASVPDIAAADVTVLDQHGVALTRAVTPSPEPGMELSGSQLDSKRSLEDYLSRKVGKILDSTFGAGTAIASVDVVLNLDQNRVTTEEVLPGKTGTDGVQSGVVVHERQTVRDNGNATAPIGTAPLARDAQAGAVTSFDNEYQVGRRVEQTVVAPGSTRRLTVAVVVKKALDDAQIEKIKEVVSLAIGLNPQRGDAVVVSTMDRLLTPTLSESSVKAITEGGASESDKPMTQAAANANAPNGRWVPTQSFWVILILAVALLLALVTLLGRQLGKSSKKRLSEAEREKLLRDVRQWIDGKSVMGETR